MLVDIEKTFNHNLLENNKISENVKELKSRTVKKGQTNYYGTQVQFKLLV